MAAVRLTIYTREHCILAVQIDNRLKLKALARLTLFIIYIELRS